MSPYLAEKWRYVQLLAGHVLKGLALALPHLVTHQVHQEVHIWRHLQNSAHCALVTADDDLVTNMRDGEEPHLLLHKVLFMLLQNTRSHLFFSSLSQDVLNHFGLFRSHTCSCCSIDQQKTDNNCIWKFPFIPTRAKKRTNWMKVKVF